MQGPIAILFYIALAGVVLALLAGIFNLARTDEKAASRSNQLMRMRVFAQFVAILALVFLGWTSGAFTGG